MTLQFDTAAIIRELDEHTYRKGGDVHRSRLVRRVEANEDGSRISGSVTGSKRAPYSQSIMLNERNGRLRITGYCTCPMAFNCKHVAAVLIELIEQRKDAEFHQSLAQLNFTAEALGNVKGLNYSNGDQVSLTLYRLKKTGP